MISQQMQARTVFKSEFARFSKNILIFVILGILIVPVTLGLVSALNVKMQSHKILVVKNHNSIVYQRQNILPLPELLLSSRPTPTSGFENNKGKDDGKKVTVNLSIDEYIVDTLRNDAKVKGVSLNARINGILSRYIKCYQRAEEFESCIIASRQFSLFLEMLDENKTIEIMKSEGNSSVVSYFQHRNIPLRLDTVIEFAFENIALTGVCCKFSQHIDQDGRRTLVFDHRYGIKWSRIISEVFSSLLSETCNIHASVIILPNSLLIKILEKDI